MKHVIVTIDDKQPPPRPASRRVGSGKSKEKKMKREIGTIQKVSKNIYGWSGTKMVIIPTAQGEVDVILPRDKFIGDNGNLYYTVSPLEGKVVIESNEDYTRGHFLNARRSYPEKTTVFVAEKVGAAIWEITKNDLPEGSVKPSPPQTYWEQFGRYYWSMGGGAPMTNTNTKARHFEIYTAAAKVLENAGGVRVIDDLPLEDRRQQLREMAKSIKEETDCHIDSAKRNLAKALRKGRYALMMDATNEIEFAEAVRRVLNWGGPRPNSGRPKVSDDD